MAPHEVSSASAVIAVRPWPLPSAGVSICISQQLRLRPRQLRGRRPVVGGRRVVFKGGAALSQGLCPRGRRRSCVIAVGQSSQDHADLEHRYHVSHSPIALRSKIRPFADCRIKSALRHWGIRLNSNSAFAFESCENGETRRTKKIANRMAF